jgi:Kef-type K+ transport system membrane component KefB
MPELEALTRDFAWPAVLLLAWTLGEAAHRHLGLPRISVYALVGFICADTQLGVLPPTSGEAVLLLANVAFGLILFEFAYRINLRWMRLNPWLLVMGLTEAALTFACVYVLAMAFGQTMTHSLLLAALSMSTSPAAIVRVINETRASGQVTERTLHLAALNCVLAVFVFKVILGYVVYENSGSTLMAAYSSAVSLTASAGIGLLAGLAMPALLRLLQRTEQDASVVFALAVVLLVALTHAFKFSALIATLAFGLMARHRRVVIAPAQRNFGPLGSLLSLMLFVFIAASIDWRIALAGLGLGAALLLTRLATRATVITAFSRLSGVTWKKGVLTAVAMTPLSAFVILLLEQTRQVGINLVDQLAPLAAAALMLEVLGPMLTQWALKTAGESPHNDEED